MGNFGRQDALILGIVHYVYYDDSLSKSFAVTNAGTVVLEDILEVRRVALELR